MLRGVQQGREQEVAAMVGEALPRFGVAGRVELDAAVIRLVGSGPTVSTELGLLLEQWELLPPDERRRRTGELARQLAHKRRAALPAARPANPRWLGRLVLVVVLLAVAVLVLRYQLSRSAQAELEAASITSAPSAIDDYERERQQRAERVCEATAARVVRGTAVGPTDVEGWVVELTLLGAGDAPNPFEHPALRQFVAFENDERGSFIWSGSPLLAKLAGPGTFVSVSHADIPDERTKWRGLTLTFHGRYVTPYFARDDRVEFTKIASSLSEQTGAILSSIYARCGHTTTHHLGSWFRGPDPARAALALIYFMGTDSAAPHVRPALLSSTGRPGTVDPQRALEAIGEATKSLTYDRIRTLIGAHGGSIAGPPRGPSIITFSFREGNQASRASYDLATQVGIASER
jgi:hypothetical protein